MIGLIGLPNGIMAGFLGNTIYLSEPYQPHSYPLLNQSTVNWPIVGIGCVSTAIVVATTAFPFIGRGVDPAAYSFKRHPGRFPCVSKRSIASSEVGVLWAMPYGIAASDGASVVNATKDFISQADWKDGFFPTTIHAKVHEGRYHGWYTSGSDANGLPVGAGFILDLGERAFLTQTSRYFTAAAPMFGSDRLFGCRADPLAGNRNSVYEWEADPSNPFVYDWKSKQFISEGLENIGWASLIANFGIGLTPAQITALQAQITATKSYNAAQPDTDGPVDGFALNEGLLDGDNTLQGLPNAGFIPATVTFKYFLDGNLIAQKSVLDENPFSLPAGINGHAHEIELGGAVEIVSVSAASTVEELARQQ
jgi:hypothetical protein